MRTYTQATLSKWAASGEAALVGPEINGIGQLRWKSGTVEQIIVKASKPATAPSTPPAPKNYTTSEFKVSVMREVTLGEPMVDTPERLYKAWMDCVPSASWFQDGKETMVLFILNTRRRLTAFNMISIGTLDTILVHPREVFRPAIVANASAILLAHNHPSGDPTPSEADIRVTRDLIRAGQLLKIEVLDHVVVGSASPDRVRPWCSLRELGYFLG